MGFAKIQLLIGYCSAYFGDRGVEYGKALNYDLWQKGSVKLYKMAAEVAKALERGGD